MNKIIIYSLLDLNFFEHYFVRFIQAMYIMQSIHFHCCTEFHYRHTRQCIDIYFPYCAVLFHASISLLMLFPLFQKFSHLSVLSLSIISFMKSLLNDHSFYRTPNVRGTSVDHGRCNTDLVIRLPLLLNSKLEGRCSSVSYTKLNAEYPHVACWLNM